jgi:hypothetical protein
MLWNDFQRAATAGAFLSVYEARKYMTGKGTLSSSHARLLMNISSLIEPVGMMQVYREKRSTNEVVNLEALLRNTKEFNSTDPRDKVYALLGLVNDDPVIHSRIVPDYNIGTDVLYRQVGKYVIQNRKDLWTLEDEFQNSGSCFKNGVLCFESWVPDFDYVPSSLPVNRNGMTSEKSDVITAAVSVITELAVDYEPFQQIFDASGHSALKGSALLSVGFFDDLRTIAAFGCIVDVVTSSLNPCSTTLHIAGIEQCITEWQSIFFNRISSGNDSFSDFVRSSSNEDLWSLVFGGRCDSHNAPADLRRGILEKFKPFPPRTVSGNLNLRREVAKHIRANLAVTCANRKMFWTRSGLVGLGPRNLLEGDVVTILYGTMVPICMRKVDGRGNQWRALGDRYVRFVESLATMR